MRATVGRIVHWQFRFGDDCQFAAVIRSFPHSMLIAVKVTDFNGFDHVKILPATPGVFTENGGWHWPEKETE